MPSRPSSRPSSGSGRQRHPVLQVTLAVVAVQALVQGLVAHSVLAETWWNTEWVRLKLRLAHPHAGYAQRLPQPGWQDWVPSAATAVGTTVALILLALLVVRSGRGWWLLAVAALPLVPAEIAPGTWAPPLTNQVANALVWPAGATTAHTTWAWVSAGITALLVALPAATYAAVEYSRPRVSPGQVLGRLAPVGLAVFAYVWWQAAAGVDTDPYLAGWYGLLVLAGAMTLTGLTGRAGRWWMPVALAVLPGLAAGAVRWTTGVDGVPQVLRDRTAWWMSAVALAGGLFAAVLQPAIANGLRRAWRYWRDMLAADVERRNRARRQPSDETADETADETVRTAAAAGDKVGDEAGDEADEWLAVGLVPDDLSELDLSELDELLDVVDVAAAAPVPRSGRLRVSRRPGRAAPERAGGRHRA